VRYRTEHHILDALASSARGKAAQFPLSGSLPERVAKLTLAERRRAARYGVFLGHDTSDPCSAKYFPNVSEASALQTSVVTSRTRTLPFNRS